MTSKIEDSQHRSSIQTAAIAEALTKAFHDTKIFWLMWDACEPTKVLPFPTLALWVDQNAEGELSGFVQSFDRTDTSFVAPAHAILYELDTAARIGFREPELTHPSVDYIKDLLLQPFWWALLEDEQFIALLVRRYRDQQIDDATHNDDMVNFCFRMLFADRKAAGMHTADQTGGAA